MINIRRANLRSLGYTDLDEWLQDKRHVYIGRNVQKYAPKTTRKDCKLWANMFPLHEYSRGRSLRLYERHVRKHLMKFLPRLDGKILGCWCAPRPCHGDILISLFKEKMAARGATQ